ncbi:hypothetical protein I203_107683 [Kwoniella mangroviensis CBS 8507]|uniref:hypothetical protein n=1 Tax=Kwoniella mangroviensis CBS 8507 TaxID=1296122 RepID=UPI00080D2E9B|nr:uncharacterized protein I203_02431 [Kwoniella mangroviensis CBS 8507]OCF69035.1 hypothetical protein I203_02431 [Kwoniella mangroviensis CBS 8507]
MIPSILLSTLPIPSLILLLLITLYHLTPLLNMLPNLTPSLQKLSSIIPHPKKSRNLPREFFNLPPRPGSPSSHKSNDEDTSIRGRLGVRGSLMIILLVEALLSLATGWYYLSTTNTTTTIATEGGVPIGNPGLIATSLVLFPSTLAFLSLFTILSKPSFHHRHTPASASKIRKVIFRNGGVTHSTLLPRILPLSILSSTITIIISLVIPTYGRYVILGYTSLCLMIVLGSGMIGMWRMITKPREGLIRLRGESRMSLYEKDRLESRSCSPDSMTDSAYRVSNELMGMTHEEGMERVRDTSSWLSSPSRPPTPVSSFDYSSPHGTVSTTTTKDTFKTPKPKPSNSSFAASASFAVPQTGGSSSVSAFTSTTTLVTPEHQSRSQNDISGSAAEGVINDQSWLSEPTNTPSSISVWSFPPSPASPQPAMTRNRSPSPSNVPLSPDEEGRDPNLPRPGERRLPVKASDSTTYTHTIGSSSTSPGSRLVDASILADYSPDPFHPLPPRGFASLTIYPVSPDQLQSQSSLITRVAALQSGDSLANGIVPVKKGSSTWTLQSAGTDAYKTPDHKISRARKVLSTADRRTPPPPPMPVDMPLPPTPTLARSSTLFDIQGKDSMEMLLGSSDWVEVEPEEEALEDWGRGGRGVGIVAVAGIVICYGLSLPLLLNGPKDMSIILYLISVLLPSPILAFTSYLLRYRPMPISSSVRSKKSSTKTTSTAHRSLALLSESQLSLPLSISPKLTPPAFKRASTMNLASPTLSKMIEPKPSLTTFIGSGRRHTVYGGLTLAEMQADEDMRKTLARRSGDVWISNGHAIEGGGLISRATEMLKPVPAMRVLEDTRRRNDDGTMKKMRGGVVSLLAKRASSLFHSQTRDDIELGQFEDADGELSFDKEITPPSPARSGIAISIIAPSPEKRLSKATTAVTRTGSSYSTGEGENGPEIDASYGTAEIGMAKRGRMSNGPMFIFGKEKERRTENGYELDWLTAGVLPGLVPSIKIGNDVRIEPAPHSAPLGQTELDRGHDRELDTPKVRQRPLSDMPISPYQEGDSSYVTMPSFRDVSFKQSTPHGGKHTHTRSYSSSVDFTLPSEYSTAETATSVSRELRQRNAMTNMGLGLGRSDTVESRRTITHKPSFRLPKLAKDDFEGEIRKSIDDLSQRPNFDNHEGGDHEESSNGIDLPPIRTTMTLKHKPSLSRVSELTEEPTLAPSKNSAYLEENGNDSSAIFSESALEDMHLALALGTTTPSSQRQNGSGSIHLRPKMSDDSTHTGDLSIVNSISTNDENLEEMERMMAMDTPTRTEFVISPPPGSTSGASGTGRDSRASDRSVSTFTSAYTATTTTTTITTNDSPLPPVPTLPLEYRQPAYPVYSHPHPPPLNTLNVQGSNSILARQISMPNIGTHPPIQSLLPKARNSTETLHSTNSTSISSSVMQSPKNKEMNHQPSKKELRIVKALEERNNQSRSQTSLGFNDKDIEKKSVVEKRGLRPLTLLADNSSYVNANERTSLVLPSIKSAGQVEGNGLRKLSILSDDDGIATRSKSSMGGGKMSVGSGKENVRKGSKVSTGSGVGAGGVSGVRGLRA